MSGLESLPRAAEPFVKFSGLLRENGFAVAPEQTISFVEAVGLLGPASMNDIHRAARATLAPQPERRAEFDKLFGWHFMGRTVAAPAPGEPEDDEILVGDDAIGDVEPLDTEDVSESGGEATGSEMLNVRRFAEVAETAALRHFRRAAPERMPMRKSYRRVPAHRGASLNMRKVLRQAVQRDGEVIELPKLDRKMRQRRIVLLVDVSGSMKQQTDGYLRFAHVLTRAGRHVEVFTIGTRLTRITRAMKLRNRVQALARSSSTVADWDGGTRLGDALQAFLAIPRYASFARGALVVVLSDGLERGDHTAMTDAVEQLSRLAWRLIWLTPLAAGRDQPPETAAMQSVMPFIDQLDDGGSVQALCDRLLALGREAV